MPFFFFAYFKKFFTRIQAVPAETDVSVWKCLFYLFHQSPAGFSFAVLLLRFFSVFIIYKLRLDTDEDLRMQYQLCFQNIIVVFPVFFVRPLIAAPVQTLPIQFLARTIQLRPVYDDLPVFPTNPHIVKGTAPQQPPAQLVENLLQPFRL